MTNSEANFPTHGRIDASTHWSVDDTDGDIEIETSNDRIWLTNRELLTMLVASEVHRGR